MVQEHLTRRIILFPLRYIYFKTTISHNLDIDDIINLHVMARVVF